MNGQNYNSPENKHFRPNQPPGPKPIEDCCCVPGIRESLKVIKECVHKFGNIPGFGIKIMITLTNGLDYTINVNVGTLNTLEIHENTIVSGNTTISLCDIAKIKLITSEVQNPSFINCLNSKLCEITIKPYRPKPPHSCGCKPKDYYAIDMDDEYERPRYRSPRVTQGRKMHNCPPEIHKTSEKFYCNTCKASKKEDCCCTNNLTNELYCNKENIKSIGLEGSVNPSGLITSISDIDLINVLDSATLTKSSSTFINDVIINTSSTTVVSSIGKNTQNVVTNISTIPTNVVTNILPSTGSALSSVTTVPTSVVGEIVLQPSIDAVVKITSNTILAAGALNINPQTVVTGLIIDPTSVVTNITPSTTLVVTGPGTTTVTNFITDMGTPTTANALTGLTSVTTVNSTTVTLPLFTTTAPSGTLEVVIPKGSIQLDPSLPAADVTLNITIGGATLALASITNFNVFSSSITALNVAGTPSVASVVTGLGTPVSAPAITSLELPTTTVVSTVTPSTIILNSISTLTNEIINNISSPTTVEVLSNISPVTAPITGVSVVNQVTIINITGQTTTSIVSGVTMTTNTISNITNINTVSIDGIGSIESTRAISEATLSISSSKALTDVNLSTTSTSVVRDIDLVNVPVVSPAEELINGVILCIGGGIMVINESSGNISIYSLCEINSFTTK